MKLSPRLRRALTGERPVFMPPPDWKIKYIVRTDERANGSYVHCDMVTEDKASAMTRAEALSHAYFVIVEQKYEAVIATMDKRS